MPGTKVALITGSAKGLGRRTALELADAGFDIVVNYRDSRDEARQLAEEIMGKGRRALCVEADIADMNAVEQLVDEVIREYGRIDVLVNNAGPFIRKRKNLVDHTLDEMRLMVDGNLTGPLWTTRLVLPYMRKQRWGRVIFFGFGRAEEAPAWPDRAPYAAAKVGLVALTKTLAIEEAAYGITVNMISPGDIRDENKEKCIDEVVALSDPESPHLRPGSGEDVSRMIRFLCEERSDYITSSIISVTGGLDVIKARA